MQQRASSSLPTAACRNLCDNNTPPYTIRSSSWAGSPGADSSAVFSVRPPATTPFPFSKHFGIPSHASLRLMLKRYNLNCKPLGDGNGPHNPTSKRKYNLKPWWKISPSLRLPPGISGRPAITRPRATPCTPMHLHKEEDSHHRRGPAPNRVGEGPAPKHRGPAPN